MNAPADRPAPEAFLPAARAEGRGRLKIFLGAAPGVGKTYEMLSEGGARAAAGADVVVGVVETHGRAETAALVEGLAVLPRREVPYEGRTLAEMDLDGLLARAPALALVDELAHTNAPGSRHPKRWQDVEELLAAGIDVFSTLNVQHLESLGDVVASFTHVRVRETVPDHVLDGAEIEVVDIPPDELIERLRQGKVYLPEEATRALAHFFSKSNLSALRELALRRAAQAVDAQMLEHVRALGIGGAWGAGERIVVAVSELPGADGLVRAARRLADAAHAPWTAVHVETARTRTLGSEAQARLAATLALATQLGAEVASIPAETVTAGLKAYAAEARATQLVVGKSTRSWWFELRHGSVVDRLVRETPDVAVHVLPLGAAPAAPRRWTRPAGQWGSPLGYCASLAMVAGVTAAGTGLSQALSLGNVALLYLLPVMAAASLYGLRTGLAAGLASSLAYNFFFLPPLYSLTISNPENVVSVVVLLGVAAATSQLAARVRAQADLAGASARGNAVLSGFLRRLMGSPDEEALARAVCEEIGRLFELRVALLAPAPAPGGELALVAANRPDLALGPMEFAAAGWAQERGVPAGRGTGTLAGADWQFRPLRAGERTLAVLGLAREAGGEPVRADQWPLLAGLIDQASLALERQRLASEMRGLDRLQERDRLRAALLSSVGHDLRTPLTAILAATAELDAADPLVGTIDAEARRLQRFVANLLDMARVETGALRLAIEPVDLTDAVAAAVHDTRAALAGRALRLEVAPDLPLVRVDPQLFHHILINLLDNAGRYGAAGTPVTVRAERRLGALVLSVLDEGRGLPAGGGEAVFAMFREVRGSDRAPGGTGLGLAIVKGFADAMDVAVAAADRLEPRGAAFSLTFPERLLVTLDEAAA